MLDNYLEYNLTPQETTRNNAKGIQQEIINYTKYNQAKIDNILVW